MLTEALLILALASPNGKPANGDHNPPGQSRAPVHGQNHEPRHKNGADPCEATNSCGQGDHGLGLAANDGHSNPHSWKGEPDPQPNDPPPYVPPPESIPPSEVTLTTCRILATGGTPELSTVSPDKPGAFEHNLLAEAHHSLIVDVVPGTYWLLFWTPTLGHSGEFHQVTCTADGGEYSFVESPFLAY